MAKEWTIKEQKWLESNYKELGPAECSKRLGRTKSSVQIKAQRLGLTTPTITREKWTQEEIDFLHENHDRMPVVDIAKELGRSRASVYRVLGRYELHRNHMWTEADYEYLRDHSHKSNKYLAKKIGCSQSAVINKRYQLETGAYRDCDGRYTFHDISRLTKESVNAISVRWTKSGLKYIRDGYRGYCKVKVDDLIRFMRKNPDLWDATKIEDISVFLLIDGAVPEWYEKKREIDIKTAEYARWYAV